jgi:hypothetical protein
MFPLIELVFLALIGDIVSVTHFDDVFIVNAGLLWALLVSFLGGGSYLNFLASFTL